MLDLEMKNVFNHNTSIPWHLWCVAVFFVLLYVAGVYDYLMIIGLNEAYVSAQNYGAAHIDYFTDYPLLPQIFWTIGIASGLVAPLLLLLRTHWAGLLALTSVISQVCLSLITFGFMNRWDVFGLQQSIFDIFIILMTFGLYLYCQRLSARDVLR